IDDLLADFKSFSKELDISFDESLPNLLARLWRKKLVRRLSVVVATLTLVTLLVLTFWPTVVEPMPIAVISFENHTGETKYDILSKVIPDLLITNLEQSGRFQVVTWQRLHDLLKQLDKDSVEFISSELGFEICRLEGVPNIIVGSIAKIGDIFATDLKVLDVKTKEILQTAQAKGNGENSILETQIDELTREVATEFGELAEEEFVESGLPIIDVTTTSLEAYKYYLLGKENLDAYSPREARDNFTKAVTLDSTFAMANISLAFAYWMEGYVEKSPKDIDIYLDRAKRYRYKVSHKEQLLLDYQYAQMKGNDYSKSISVLKKATSLYPKEKQIFKSLGDYYHNFKSDFDSAIVFYGKILDLDPNDKYTLNIMGYVYLKKKDYAKALEYLQRYADVAPNEWNPYDSMGDVYRRMRDYTKSIEMYEKALKLNPNSWSHIRIAQILIKMGEYEKARNQLYQGLEIASSYLSSMRTHLVLAISYIAEGNLESPLKEMENISNLAMQKSDTVSLAKNQFDISEILYENDKIKEAEEKLAVGKELTDSLDESEGYKNILRRKYFWHSTRLAVKKGEIDQAKDYAEMYKKRAEKKENPNHMKRYFTLSGLIAYAEGNYGKVISDLKKSNLDDPFNNYHLALAYIKIGDEPKAIEKLETVLNIHKIYYNFDLRHEMVRSRAENQLSLLRAGD
ncbi:MAG: tetratricopeptide repeat protein, partial [Candidatus Kariarchaeaceae archaeon]